MSVIPELPQTLAAWLAYIEALHPKSIEMGLERVNLVRQRLSLSSTFPVIIVAGTNGKGSTCAMLERIYHEAGYRVGCYTSPHLLRYNERVRVACNEASDTDLCAAFAAVEAARQDTALTYFEFGTLAAYWHFAHADLDVAILEVGLGGRLDAVNSFEPTCSIVTSVDMDHMDFLGNDRESIGYEKAGVYRTGIPAICGDIDPPASLLRHAAHIRANLLLIGRDFSCQRQGEGWRYQGMHAMDDLPFPALPGDFQLYNAAAVIAAVEQMQSLLPVTQAALARALTTVQLAGRFERISQQPDVILDVAHNPHAAEALADNLANTPCQGRTLAVFAMLADKDIAGVVEKVAAGIDAWYLADIANPRGATAQRLADEILQVLPDEAPAMACYPDVVSAYRQACMQASKNDRIIVFGSFFTVADVMHAASAIHSETQDS